MGTPRHAPRAALVLLALACASCFYDSRWLQGKQSLASAAQHAKPSELHATPVVAGGETSIGEAPPKRAARVLRVRARATARYAAEVVDWPHQLEELLDETTQVLAPTLSIRLEVVETKPWAPRAGDDDLAALVDELYATDPGADVDWVIGLVGSLPRVETSIHQLGMGRVMSKHFVMRAMNDAREYEAIEQRFAELDEQARRKLYRARKKHKATTVFLHELGHTLGAPHEPDVTTIMHPSYDPKVEGFSDAAAGLMRLTLEHRLAPGAQEESAFLGAVLAYVKAHGTSWVAGERDQMVATLEQAVAIRSGRGGGRGVPTAATAATVPTAPGGPAASAAPAAVVDDEAVASMRAEDRAVYARAVGEMGAGNAGAAGTTAKALFKAYPDVYAVQDLRCQIAMALGLAWNEVQAQCERLTALTEGLSAKARRKHP